MFGNDTALDVRDEIEDIFAAFTEEEDIDKKISNLSDGYKDEDDTGIAWLAAVECSQKKNALDIKSLYKDFIAGRRLADDAKSTIIKYMGDKTYMKRCTKSRSGFDAEWHEGDVYVYDIRDDYAQLPEFNGNGIGFICIGYYAYRGKNPIVYVFRIKKGIVSVDDIIDKAQFWKACNWSELGYAYRAMMWGECDENIYKSRFHYIGNTTSRPEISDEFVIYDAASHPCIYWDEIENSLLRTRKLMAY